MSELYIFFTILALIISAVSAIVSFYFSRKSKENADLVSLNDYISQAVEEFNKKGSPFDYIRSLLLSDDKKEIIWRQCYIRHKGRHPERLFADVPPSSEPFGFGFVGDNPSEKIVIKELGSGQFEDRTLKSLSEVTGINKKEVEEDLKWLWDNGLAQKRTTHEGTFWSLTERGWKLYQNISK